MVFLSCCIVQDHYEVFFYLNKMEHMLDGILAIATNIIFLSQI